MSLAAVPCELPSTGATSVSIIVVGCFAIAVGIMLTRLASRKHRLPLSIVLVLIATLCATVPHAASATTADCSASSSLGELWPGVPKSRSDSVVLDCDYLSPGANLGYVIPFGGPDGTFTGYGDYEFPLGGGLPIYFGFLHERSWIDPYLPTSVTYEWQILSRGKWTSASWDTGLNPLEITNNQSLLSEVEAALFTDGTGRLLIRATDGTTEQVCAVSYWEEE